MATIEKRGASYRARVRKDGVDRTETFPTKAQAKAWATQLEADILAGKIGGIPNHTFGDLMQRYMEEVSPKKRSGPHEITRLKHMQRYPIAKVRLPMLNETHVVAWRDQRLQETQSASVRRDWNTLSNVCTVAITQWKWLKVNPFTLVPTPEDSTPRNRRPQGDELERMLHVLGYSESLPIDTKLAAIGAAALFAVETAMREAEICRLRWCDVDGRVAHVLQSKNDTATHVGRMVPLSQEALRILSRLPRHEGDDRQPCFGLSAASLSTLWRKARTRAGVEDLRFHDLRREATTRLAKKLDVLTLAKVTGHRDLRILQRVYYAPDMQDIATQLD